MLTGLNGRRREVFSGRRQLSGADRMLELEQ